MKVHNQNKYLCVYVSKIRPDDHLQTIISSRVELSSPAIAEKFYSYYSIRVFSLIKAEPYKQKFYNGRKSI